MDESRFYSKKELSGFGPPAQLTLSLLGVVVAERPEAIKTLLGRYGIACAPPCSPASLTAGVLYGIGKEDKGFHLDLARVLAEKLPHELHYDGYTDTQGPPAIALGADPVSAIAAAVGSIAQVVGQRRGEKHARRQAASHTLSVIAHRNALSRQAALAHRRRGQLIKVIAMFIFLGAAILAMMHFFSPPDNWRMAV